MLKGYFDDSQTEKSQGVPSWVLAGFIGDDLHWDGYNQMWPLALATHDVPYFHAREFGDRDGVYKKWHPLHEHEVQRGAFMADLAKVIGQCGLRGFSCVVRKPDVERFNREYRLRLQPYPLAVYGCMIAVNHYYESDYMELVFDHVEKVGSKLDKAKDYAYSDSYWTEANFKRIQLTPLGEAFTFKQVIELQAADYHVGEARKQHIKMDGWFSSEGKPKGWNERGDHMEKWAEENGVPKHLRPPLEALIRYEPPTPFVWDYDRLCEAHQLRNGVWSVGQAA